MSLPFCSSIFKLFLITNLRFGTTCESNNLFRTTPFRLFDIGGIIGDHLFDLSLSCSISGDMCRVIKGYIIASTNRV